jgi:DNA-binding MarR family transcriptional regulator
MADRPLTEQQRIRLMIAAFYGITLTVERSMPSLARRGLAERYHYTEHGRRYAEWRLTDAGRAEARRLQDLNASSDA